MTLLRPIIVLYGVETWALRKSEKLRLVIFKRKILRKMYGPVIDSQTKEWKKLNNDEFQRQFQKPNIVKEISKKKLMWAGHAWHKQRSIVKQVIEEDVVRKRPLERPK